MKAPSMKLGRQILNHFRRSTTMAYSIKNGIALYQKDGFINSLLKMKLSKPSKIWMKEWFEHWLRFYQMLYPQQRAVSLQGYEMPLMKNFGKGLGLR